MLLKKKTHLPDLWRGTEGESLGGHSPYINYNIHLPSYKGGSMDLIDWLNIATSTQKETLCTQLSQLNDPELTDIIQTLIKENS